MKLSYFFLSSGNKTRWLLTEARRDAVMAPIVDDLEAFGFSIKHSFWEGNGLYQPYALSVSTENFEAEFLKQLADGKFKAEFVISSRHGAGAALFHFLHELIHFMQDLEGRIQDPRDSLEAEAAVESIAAAYRLKQAGYAGAWRGAMGSVNWRSLAKLYERTQNAEDIRRRLIKSTGAPSPQKFITAPVLWKKLKRSGL
jgi:hypothetical protein